MRASVLALLLGFLLAGSAAAETLVVDGHVQVVKCPEACPHRGITMKQVEKGFGAPIKRYPAVGKPPITRWDYPAFSVYFEYNRVVHSVAHAQS
jgi:hypothetical protein